MPESFRLCSYEAQPKDTIVYKTFTSVQVFASFILFLTEYSGMLFFYQGEGLTALRTGY